MSRSHTRWLLLSMRSKTSYLSFPGLNVCVQDIKLNLLLFPNLSARQLTDSNSHNTTSSTQFYVTVSTELVNSQQLAFKFHHSRQPQHTGQVCWPLTLPHHRQQASNTVDPNRPMQMQSNCKLPKTTRTSDHVFGLRRGNPKELR